MICEKMYSGIPISHENRLTDVVDRVILKRSPMLFPPFVDDNGIYSTVRITVIDSEDNFLLS